MRILIFNILSLFVYCQLGLAFDGKSYPSYGEYTRLLYSLQEKYPHLCKVSSIGTTPLGKDILVIKISDAVAIKEAEPEFLYTATIHGDETVGFVLLLNLAQYLAENYQTDNYVQSLVDGVEIWINPLANPDGTYLNDTIIVSPQRNNANNVDLNRNFPDPRAGNHPDGNLWQPETMAMMEFMQKHNFVLSANFHAGVQVLNYPWDTWTRGHVDSLWFADISRKYADTAQFYAYAKDSIYYMTGFDNGITNGAKWYQISGGRQDYVTYFLKGREVTIELSDMKFLDPAELDNHWEYNHRSMLHYIEQSTYGITGIVTDSLTNVPLKAKINIAKVDTDTASYIWADANNGNYHRLISPGYYSVKASAVGYRDKTMDSVLVMPNQSTEINYKLTQNPEGIHYSIDNSIVSIYPNPFCNSITIDNIDETITTTATITNLQGKIIYNQSFTHKQQMQINTENIHNGVYLLKIVGGNFTVCKKVIKQD